MGFRSFYAAIFHLAIFLRHVSVMFNVFRCFIVKFTDGKFPLELLKLARKFSRYEKRNRGKFPRILARLLKSTLSIAMGREDEGPRL